MGPGVAVEAFEHTGVAEEVTAPRIVLFHLPEFGDQFKGPLKSGAEVGRDEFGDGVHFGIGHVEHSSHIPHDQLGLHRSEGDDLADMILAVGFLHILDHPRPVAVGVIDVEIGHAHTVRG